MAHIFKKATKDSKGIIVFTHKEWSYFSAIKPLRRIKRAGLLPAFLDYDIKPSYERKIKKLRRKYVVGVHFGFYYPHHFSSKLVDFVMASEKNLPHLDKVIYRIPLNSRNFIPSNFKPDQTCEKIWDVIAVARDVKFKHIPRIFTSIKKSFSINPDLRYLLIVPSQYKDRWGKEKGLADFYYQTFDNKERDNVTFLYLHPTLRMGIQQSQLIKFYNQSRAFTLFSEAEGESRVISEALCCGLPVIAYAGLKGGGLDLLDDTNARLFKNFDDAHNSFVDALNAFPTGLGDTHAKLTREDFMIEPLHEHFGYIYQRQEALFDEQLDVVDSLDMRLPAHYMDVEWCFDKSKPTADILSVKQFTAFESYLYRVENQE